MAKVYKALSKTYVGSAYINSKNEFFTSRSYRAVKAGKPLIGVTRFFTKAKIWRFFQDDLYPLTHDRIDGFRLTTLFYLEAKPQKSRVPRSGDAYQVEGEEQLYSVLKVEFSEKQKTGFKLLVKKI